MIIKQPFFFVYRVGAGGPGVPEQWYVVRGESRENTEEHGETFLDGELIGDIWERERNGSPSFSSLEKALASLKS